MFCVVNKCVTLVDLTTTKRRYILRGLLLIKIFQIRQKGKDAAVSRSAAPMLHVTNIPASFRPAIFFVAQFLSPAADKTEQTVYFYDGAYQCWWQVSKYFRTFIEPTTHKMHPA